MKDNLVWILATDGSHARIFQQDNRTQSLYQIKDLHHNHELTHEHGRDKPGRAFESASDARHAYEPKTDWHEHQKDIFAQELAQVFIKEHEEKKFKKAYLVCPPKILGALRSRLSSYVSKLPVAKNLTIQEVPKDLTHHTLKEVEECIAMAS